MQSVLEKNYSKPKIVTEPIKTNGGPKSFRWTVREYYQMAELGFFYGKRVELIKGEIIVMSPVKSGHFTAVRLLSDLLVKAFGKGFDVRQQAPLTLSKTEEPEPDIGVVEGSIRDYSNAHPKSAKAFGRSLRFITSLRQNGKSRVVCRKSHRRILDTEFGTALS